MHLPPFKNFFSKLDDGFGENTAHSAVSALTIPVSSAFELLGAFNNKERRRTVLIATLEYDIADWDIKIKIGGLGVMAQVMTKNLGHQDLVWVVPCVGDV